jgi:hypothetical protein
MSKRATESLEECVAKISYQAKLDAAFAAKNLTKRTKVKTIVYPCSFCKGFHLSRMMNKYQKKSPQR